MNTLIEHCCCERQAPAAIKTGNGQAMMFTNGDVTVSDWFKALSYMAGPSHKMIIIIKEPDVQLLRWIKNWFQRGWTTEVVMTNKSDHRELIAAELEGLTDKVSVAVDASVYDELVAFSGERGTVVIQGRMLTDIQPGLTMYGCYLVKSGDSDELVKAAEARHRSHLVKTELPTTADNDTVAEEPTEATATTVKPRRGKKNNTENDG